jgi:hypothetical protein
MDLVASNFIISPNTINMDLKENKFQEPVALVLWLWRNLFERLQPTYLVTFIG